MNAHQRRIEKRALQRALAKFGITYKSWHSLSAMRYVHGKLTKGKQA